MSALFKGWFTETKQYFCLVLGAAITAFVGFRAALSRIGCGVPKWTAWLAFILPVLVFLWKTAPRLLEWRHKRVFVKSAQKDATKSNASASAASLFDRVSVLMVRSDAIGMREPTTCTRPCWPGCRKPMSGS